MHTLLHWVTDEQKERYRNAGQCSGLRAGGEGPRGSAR
jgi:hypothetical protein